MQKILDRMATDIAIANWRAARAILDAFGPIAEIIIANRVGLGLTQADADHLITLVTELRKEDKR